jgi:transposase
VAFALTPGNIADITVAPVLLDAVAAAPARLLADKAYDADAFRDLLKAPKVEPVIPSTPPASGPTRSIAEPTADAISSSVCSAASKTGGASPPAMTASPATTSQPSPSSQSLVSGPPD